MRALFVLLTIAVVIVNGEEEESELANAMKRSMREQCPPPVCFQRLQKCCYIYQPCGKVTRDGAKSVRQCVKRVCVKRKSKRCVKKCRDVRETVKRRVCREKLVQAGTICGKVWVNRDGNRVCIKVCKPRYKKRKFCLTETSYKPNKKCDNKCENVVVVRCRQFQRRCCESGQVTYPKFCPKLICDKVKNSGKWKKPKDALHGENGGSLPRHKHCDYFKKLWKDEESKLKLKLEQSIDDE